MPDDNRSSFSFISGLLCASFIVAIGLLLNWNASNRERTENYCGLVEVVGHGTLNFTNEPRGVEIAVLYFRNPDDSRPGAGRIEKSMFGVDLGKVRVGHYYRLYLLRSRHTEVPFARGVDEVSSCKEEK